MTERGFSGSRESSYDKSTSESPQSSGTLSESSTKRSERTTSCHPDRKHYAKGKCQSCYYAQYVKERRRSAPAPVRPSLICKFCNERVYGANTEDTWSRLKYHVMDTHGPDYENIQKWIKNTEQVTRVLDQDGEA